MPRSAAGRSWAWWCCPASRPVAAGYGGGTVYSPRAGKAYPADLAVTADGRLELKVKAGLLTKTDYWTR